MCHSKKKTSHVPLNAFAICSAEMSSLFFRNPVPPFKLCMYLVSKFLVQCLDTLQLRFQKVPKSPHKVQIYIPSVMTFDTISDHILLTNSIKCDDYLLLVDSITLSQLTYHISIINVTTHWYQTLSRVTGT